MNFNLNSNHFENWRNSKNLYKKAPCHNWAIPYGLIYRQFGIAQVEASIKNKIRFHDLRHTFASKMNGGNDYAHLSPNHLQGSLRFMGGENDQLVESDKDFRTVLEPQGETTGKFDMKFLHSLLTKI